MPHAIIHPFQAPADVPTIRSKCTCSRSTVHTPTSHAPNIPPADRTNAVGTPSCYVHGLARALVAKSFHAIRPQRLWARGGRDPFRISTHAAGARRGEAARCPFQD